LNKLGTDTFPMELILEIGIENIAAELLRKRALLVPALKNKGYTVLNAQAPLANASGIVTFYRDGADLAAVDRRPSAVFTPADHSAPTMTGA